VNKFLLCLLILVPAILSGQPFYSRYFLDKSMRFDFLLTGNDKNVKVFQEDIKEEPFWGGSKTNLIDPFNYGSYRFRVFDLKSDSLLFSKGFSTLFQEWQTTAEAKTTEKSFYQAAIFPFPKKKVKFLLDARDHDGNFHTIFKTDFDPENYFIKKEAPLQFDTRKIVRNGNPAEKVDIVILAEGYTKNELGKFIKDAERLTSMFFEEEPFKSEEKKFNVSSVLVPSEESGTDIPGEKVYKNTRFNSTFYTFDLPRYLTSSDMKNIYDAAACVPYDQIYLLVNTERYGGGGFYNLVTVCSADNEKSKNVFVHEFGHGFAGLGDEYYNSTVAYEDFYNLKVEPWEPNLTTLIDFSSKWKNMVPPDIPIPTPREAKYKNTVGAFEGGGYMNKGIFSPSIDCRMKSNEAPGFCPVCTASIRRMINWISGTK
jgi:hypothetical protein